MKKAVISSVVDLTEGGCNACGVVEAVSYTITLDEREIPLDELTVSSLVMTIVLRNGFSQEMKMDILEDYILFKKADLEIKLIEAYGSVKLR